VGGGVIGICCAYFLAKRGARVIVLERDDIGKAASFGNAGCIAPGHPPINRPGRIRQALKSLFLPLSPLYVAPRLDPALAKWLWAFRRTCTERHVDLAMRILAPLGRETRRLFDELVETEKLECGFRREGYYEIYLTQSGLESARQEAALISRYGIHPQTISGAALRETEPAFRDHVLGGTSYPEAATINPYQFAVEMARRAEGYGVDFRTGVNAVSVRTTGRKSMRCPTSGWRIRRGHVHSFSGWRLYYTAHPKSWCQLSPSGGEGLPSRL
jgi:D-amino-acid dehydrogenase